MVILNVKVDYNKPRCIDCRKTLYRLVAGLGWDYRITSASADQGRPKDTGLPALAAGRFRPITRSSKPGAIQPLLERYPPGAIIAKDEHFKRLDLVNAEHPCRTTQVATARKSVRSQAAPTDSLECRRFRSAQTSVSGCSVRALPTAIEMSLSSEQWLP